MKFRNLFLASIVICAPVISAPVFAQSLSVGVVGGTSLTDAFSDKTITGVDTSTHLFSDSKDFIVGPMLQVNLPLGFSVEADALYRRLNLTAVNRLFAGPGLTVINNNSTNSWEFPILAKYSFGTPFIKPFIEAGPSFRHVSEFTGDSPHLSRDGFTVGVGVGFKLLSLRVDPQLRYTRWGSDSKPSTSSFNPASHANQAEFLLGLSF